EADGATNAELEDIQQAQYKSYDNVLNDIYKDLQGQLSDEKMQQLKEEQTEWIKERDAYAKKRSAKYSGGSMESLTYVTAQAEKTKERCYELIRKIDKE